MPVQAEQRRPEHEQRAHDGEEEHAQARAEVPVEEVADDQLDQGRERDLALAPEQRGRDVEADGEQEDQHAARGHARQAQGEEDPEEGLARGRAEAAGGRHEGGVDPGHDAEQREHHERQQHVHHADLHAHHVVDEGERPVDHAPPDEDLVDEASLSEDHHPGERAHEDARPERHQHEHDQDGADARRDDGHQVGERVAEHAARRR